MTFEDRKLLRQLIRICYDQCDTQNTAVGRDQRQEYTQRLIQRRTHLLEHDLNHLHQRSDDQNEEDGLQKLYMPQH